MALTMSYNAECGVTFATAYFRVVKIDLDVQRKRAAIEYWVYCTKAIRQADANAVLERKIIPVHDGDVTTPFTEFFGAAALNALNMNPTKAAYLYLKSLGTFATGVDDGA